MDYRVNMFNKFDMTEDEKAFVINVDSSGGMSMDTSQIHSILAQFYHAKQLEQSGKSSDKAAKGMFWLTVAIMLFTAMQGVSAILTYIK